MGVGALVIAAAWSSSRAGISINGPSLSSSTPGATVDRDAGTVVEDDDELLVETDCGYVRGTTTITDSGAVAEWRGKFRPCSHDPKRALRPLPRLHAYTLYSPVRAGIPYASPPVDGLRWKAPEDVTCWDGVLDGSAYGDQCAQQSPWSSVGGGDGQEVVGNEDCLYLNVFAPDGWATRSAMPVVVWIHGGSLVRVSSHRASHVPRPTSHLLLRPTSHLTSPASASPRSRLPSGRCP